jgi:hypothetical protein
MGPHLLRTIAETTKAAFKVFSEMGLAEVEQPTPVTSDLPQFSEDRYRLPRQRGSV